MIFLKKTIQIYFGFLDNPCFSIKLHFFDLRHDNILSKQVLSFVSLKTGEGESFNYLSLVTNRIDSAFKSPEILRRDPYGYINLILFLVTLIFIAIQIKDNKNRDVYLSFLYLYFGFFVLSFIDKGPILYFYPFPIFPLVFLIFSSFITSRFKTVFVVLFGIVLIFNMQNGLNDIKDSKAIIGKNIYSWKFLKGASEKIFENKENEIGYFVYSPDVFAYEGKYAMIYTSEHYDKKSYYFQKKPITYLLIAPPPVGNPYMEHEWWVKNQLNIDKKPEKVTTFTNNYKIEKYLLNDEEISIPFDPAIDPGIHFR